MAATASSCVRRAGGVDGSAITRVMGWRLDMQTQLALRRFVRGSNRRSRLRSTRLSRPRGSWRRCCYYSRMQVYLVGGAVRDALLGLAVKERDWVVVGGTREELLRLKYPRSRPRFSGVSASRDSRGACAGAARAQGGARLSRIYRRIRAAGDARGGSRAPRSDHQRHGSSGGRHAASTPSAAGAISRRGCCATCPRPSSRIRCACCAWRASRRALRRWAFGWPRKR